MLTDRLLHFGKNLKTTFDETDAPIAAGVAGVSISLVQHGVPAVVVAGPIVFSITLAATEIIDIANREKNGTKKK